MATVFQDTFNRADQSNWGTASGGGDWTTTTGGSGASVSISSNRGANTGSGSGDAGAYHALSQQSGIVITFTYATQANFTSDSTVFWVGVRNTTTNRLTNAYGAIFGQGAITIKDSNTDKATASFTFSNSTLYNVEMDYNSDNHLDIYVWADGGSKPGTPSLSFTNGGSPYTPTSSGSNIVMTVTYNSPTTSYFDDLLITDGAVAASGAVHNLGLLGVGQ